MDKISFDQLPEMVAMILEKIEGIEKQLSKNGNIEISYQDELMTVNEASEFLNLATSTIYSKVCRREIPVMKPGKRLYFNKKELINWLNISQRKTSFEINLEANQYLKSRGKNFKS